MSMPSDIKEREYAKFVETITGQTAIRVEATVAASAPPVGASTEAKQDDQIVELQEINTHLQNLENYTDQIESFTDDLENLSTTLNATATAIANSVDGLEGFTDQIESKLDSANALLTTIRDNADQVETLLTNIGNNTDGLEGFSDGVEGLITATNALLTAIRDNADQLEGFLDGVEALITTTNTTLSTGIAPMLDKHASGSIASPDTTTVIGPLACGGMASLGLLLTGSWSGSCVVEITKAAAPGATDWTAIRAYNDNGNIGQNPVITNGSYTFGLGTSTFVRFRRSNAGSGTVVAELNLSVAPAALKVASPNFNDFSVACFQSGAGVQANAWFTRITDAANGTVAVKAASTAAVVADPSLVVQQSPNGNHATAANQASVIALLTTIRDNADTVESLLTAIGNNTDGLEGFVDGLEGLVTASNALLTTIRDNADQLEGYLDTVEALITSTNTKLDTLIAKDFATSAKQDLEIAQLTAINANTDAIETKIDSTNALLTTIRDNADTVETLITSTNTKLDTLHADVDGVETLITSTNTKLDRLAFASTASLTTGTATTTSATLLAANANRRGIIFVNTNNKDLYIAYAATATVTAYTHFVPANGSLTIMQPIYTGLLSIIASGSGATYAITELT